MDQIRVPLGSTQPPIDRQLVRRDNKPVDLSDAALTVQFFMRRYESATLLVAAAPASKLKPDEGIVRYEPAAGDFASEGRFTGWFRVLSGGTNPEDFDEFELLVYAHDYGAGARLGPIARAARAEMPVAWDLVRDYEAYGDPELSRKVETVKLNILRATVPVGDEESLDLRVIDYIGKAAALEIIEAAIDIWSDRIVSQSTPRGDGEVHTFPDRIAALERKKKRLEEWLAKNSTLIGEIIGHPLTRVSRGPEIDDVELITPGLEDFPPPYPRTPAIHGNSAIS